MHSSFVCLFLTVLVANLSWSVLAGDYPVVGIVLLQSAPRFQAFGSVVLIQKGEDAPINVEGIILNLKPNSRFGLHVHEQGDLTNACQSTGAHFNPYGKHHGSEKSVERHWGDFGNIMSDASGTARVMVTIEDVSLIGADGYIGRALVLHEREDDLGLTDHEMSRKTGNSGERLACGVIGIRRPTDRLPLPQPTQKATLGQQRPFNFVPTFQQQSQNMRTV
ncbi:unnamed protein product [Adineta ricciae]|uniref:Superoxide dismutase [Cu-Zn] n=1 Tax=Adineta ricciae TaxID=249248 RepID=A0A813PUV3_ADIRI|nr:unnamed protein product [Adineta ricciae]CAF1373600.1 unnamed protein product [Adineta ricciae]